MKKVKKTNYKRPVLDEARIKQCHEIVDKLVMLHRETDPALGKKSEKYKSAKAYQAINEVGMLGAILTEWAEGHILGSYYHVAQSEDEWISDDESDSHKNEGMWHSEEYHKALFSDEQYVVCMRAAIADIIRNSLRLSGAMAWRMLINDGLYALNVGQVDWLLAPAKTSLQGDAFDLQKLKWAAVCHVYKLVGEGWKKTAAQQHVAECCGTTFEAIKKWERQESKGRDNNKVELKGMERGAKAITLFKKSSDYDEEQLLIVAANACIKTNLESEEAIEKKEFFCDITFCFRLDQLYPLAELKDRLAEAGMRLSE